MSSILDTSSLYSAYNTSFSTTNAASLQNSLANVDGENADADELMEVCKSFESYFVQKVIEQTKKSVLDNEDEEGEYMKYFGDILNEQYANIITDSGGVGLAKQLYDSMKDRYNL